MQFVSLQMADELPIRTLDAAIAKLTAESALDERGQQVLAAAITLRDSSGRDRSTALRHMTSTWGVIRRVKIEGKWKDRPLAIVASELETAVCLAAAQWQPEPAGEGAAQRGVSEHAPSTSVPEQGPAKKARTCSAESTEAPGSSQPHCAGHEPQLLALAETQEDVVALKRLGPDHFEATKRSGELWTGPAELLETLPQGKAKFATLRVTEIMGSKKARTTGDQNVLRSKKARTTGASEHVVEIAGAPAREPETAAASAGAGLFAHDSSSDHALLEWLRQNNTQPRCAALLQQIAEWTGKDTKQEMRALVRGQGILRGRDDSGSVDKLQEAVRRHFRSAIAQEKGRLATFHFHISTGVSEHLAPMPGEAAQPIQVVDVVDLATMKRYRRQHADLPNALKEGILAVAGGIAVNRTRLRAAATGLQVRIQTALRYPGGDASSRRVRKFKLPLHLEQTMLTATCLRRVRAWGATAAVATARQSRIFTTPQTLPELANMLRDPEGRLICPFGIDFERLCGADSYLDSLHRIPFWLALLEVHGDGFRYGAQSERHLPCAFEQVIGILRQRRVALQEAEPGASEHSLVVSDDLVKALVANTVFRHKIATHDLLTYAMKESSKYLSQVTTEQLQQGDMMAPDSLMPAAAAEIIATTFFDFVVKHSLADTMQQMSSEQIQVIAVFLNHLLRKPSKRIHISERLDLIQKKPAYTSADAIASPKVLLCPLRMVSRPGLGMY